MHYEIDKSILVLVMFQLIDERVNNFYYITMIHLSSFRVRINFIDISQLVSKY